MECKEYPCYIVGCKTHDKKEIKTQNISNPTNPLPNVEILTPEECGLLYHNLKNQWVDRAHQFKETNALVTRLYRRSVGLSNE